MRQIVLLRGINLGPRNRIAMPVLRGVLTDAGFADVATYVQSGNVVLSSDVSPEELASDCKRRIADAFGLAIDVVVRTSEELAAVVERNPLGEMASNPRRYQVSFLSAELDAQRIEKLASLVATSERFAAVGRELYAWHPDGIAHSKLWAALAGRGLGITATTRNWTTVTALHALAGSE